MPHKAKSHQEVLESYCGVCTRAAKNRKNITPRLLRLIQQFHYDNYILNSWLPSVTCGSCYTILGSFEKGDAHNRKLPVVIYDDLARPGPQTSHFCTVATKSHLFNVRYDSRGQRSE